MEVTLALHSLTPLNWRMLLAARLRALLNPLHAFTSSYASESVWSEPEWRRMFDAANWFIVRDDEKWSG